jgi:hypothetical protein
VAAGRLAAETVETAALVPELVEHLYRLHARSYEGSDPARFRADLGEKEWVILLRDGPGGAVVGFSTQKRMDVMVNGRPVRALFSGDTLIAPGYWGEQALVRAWCRLAGRLKAQTPDRPLYWFLISKGHRTYLYLPTFFLEFYPRHDRDTPSFEAGLIAALGLQKYPGDFNPKSGLIEPQGAHDRLLASLDGSGRRAANPHVAFFLERNPRHAEGHELVCVAEIAAENMRSVARRELLAELRPARSA